LATTLSAIIVVIFADVDVTLEDVADEWSRLRTLVYMK